jgi:hypothetical protein
MNLINLDQDRGKWCTVVNTVMNTQVPYNAANSWLAENIFASQEGLCSVVS